MPSVLVVDDEDDLTWAVGHALRGDGLTVHLAYDGASALAIARRHTPDICVLDVNMPWMDGFQLCHALRAEPGMSRVPVLFITGRNTVEDRVRGLDEGGDDYLSKPFDLRELRARVRALLRRSQATPSVEPPMQLHVGALCLDLRTREVRVGSKTCQLTPAEFDLLNYLMQRPNQVFSSTFLLRQVWGYTPETAEVSLVRWHVMNLRAKIEENPSNPNYICTVARHGYILRNPQEEDAKL
ncbi:response regulator transcription factor [Candidatus Viridilinea mediisalina]|uniref:DNA-binding response regulator n=1 Tax=Candidatus Viridilinea mediisalina TaxID=2024553 RepID=A0A2A6RJI6_9CHLR|nr:response regulator transcription factor [Candidatus Viridilinea mediisalina]PDW03010.1 hypothetical protein CJ255_11105 [Candidatus Viridilinea mediisalina]